MQFVTPDSGSHSQVGLSLKYVAASISCFAFFAFISLLSLVAGAVGAFL